MNLNQTLTLRIIAERTSLKAYSLKFHVSVVLFVASWIVASTLTADDVEARRENSVQSETDNSTLGEIDKEDIQSRIRRAILMLKSDQYAERKVAYEVLIENPDAAISEFEDAVVNADRDYSTRLIRILSVWANKPDVGVGKKAWQLLERIAQMGIGSKSQLSELLMHSISEEQCEISEEKLKKLGAFIGDKRIQVITTALDKKVLSIADNYRGTVEDLSSVRWINDCNVVHLDGERIDRAWLEKIVTMHGVEILQLSHTSLTKDDLDLIRKLKSLTTLEILYSPIDDGAIEQIATLPIWGYVRLFGTKVTQEGAGKLRDLMEGTQITYGRGGFLGIQSNNLTLEISMITPGSGAEKGGLQVYDTIRTINGKPLSNFEDLRAELAKLAAGESVVIEVERLQLQNINRLPSEGRFSSEIISLNVTLGEQ